MLGANKTLFEQCPRGEYHEKLNLLGTQFLNSRKARLIFYYEEEEFWMQIPTENADGQ